MANDLAARQVAAVLAVGRAMAATGDYEKVLSDVIEAVCGTVDASSGGFMLYDPERDELVLQKPAFGVHAATVVSSYRVSVSAGGNAARVFLSREPYVANDARRNPRMLQQFIKLFKTRNTVTVPLILGDRPIGVFHAINKRSGVFVPDDVALLSLVAPLLATVLQSARMFKVIETERHKLERAMHIHAVLTRTVQEAHGIDRLCTTLSELLQRPVLVLDAMRRAMADAGWLAGGTATAARAAVALAPSSSLQRVTREVSGPELHLNAVAIMLGAHAAGFIVVEDGGAPLDAIDRKAIEQAATVFAVEILQERSAFEAERRVAGDLLGDLFETEVTGEVALAILKRLGFTTKGPWRVARIALISAEEETALEPQVRRAISATLKQQELSAALLPWRNGFVTVLPASAAERLQTPAAERAFGRALRANAPGAPALALRVGIGRAESAATALAWSLHSAEQALRAAQRLQIARPVFFEDLGVYRLLLSPNHGTDHAEFVETVLGRLYRADATSRRAVLMPTLEVLVAHDFNLAEAARSLGLHLNTIKYRVKKLAELLGGDPARGERRLEIELALKVAQLQRGQVIHRGAIKRKSVQRQHAK
ncbi:MAG: helix-turn-helix domain-containing protein [Gammaproteobacteria bacterium]|nr:helix-turn-helix domain-containing protein [Gammaproteobacteria bacterium]